jgi:hypothetical protein
MPRCQTGEYLTVCNVAKRLNGIAICLWGDSRAVRKKRSEEDRSGVRSREAVTSLVQWWNLSFPVARLTNKKNRIDPWCYDHRFQAVTSPQK